MANPFYTIKEIQSLLAKDGKKTCYETARRAVSRWNRELASKGYTTYRGIVPKKYVHERMGLV